LLRWWARKLEQSWFDEKLGWDLKAIREHAGFGEKQKFALERLASMNAIRRDNQKKLDNLTAGIKKLGSLVPYNHLFDLMEKHDMKYDHFLHAEVPPMYQFSERAYKVGDGYLAHLRPGRLLSFREADGEMVETVLRECSRCYKVRENVWDEFCYLEQCGTTISVCRDCTTNRTCFSCKVVGCKCEINQCSADDCQNYICRNVPDSLDEDDSDESDDSGHNDIRTGPGCSFVFYSEDTDWDDEDDLMDAEQYLYCTLHKPAGAVKFDRRNR
jgi:hypothetical protein